MNQHWLLNIKHYQAEWFRDIALYSIMFLFIAGVAGTISYFLHIYIDKDTVLYNSLSYIKLALFSLDVFGFVLMALFTTIKLMYEILIDFNKTTVQIKKDAKDQSYQLLTLEFSNLVDIIGNRLDNFNPNTSDNATIELLHWVPTFSLSRGIKSNERVLVPSESTLYLKIKKHLEEYGGKIICYDGLSMYRFLFESKLLYGKPSNYAIYLREAHSIIKNNNIDVAFFNDDGFPYTLLIIGNEYASMDFTSKKDLLDAHGFSQASHQESILINTSEKEEVKRVRDNIFDPYFRSCTMSANDYERKRTLLFLENVANEIEVNDILESPNVYKNKYWDNQ